MEKKKSHKVQKNVGIGQCDSWVIVLVRHVNYQYIFLCVRHGVEVGEGMSLCMCVSKNPYSIVRPKLEVRRRPFAYNSF